jgi:hypothetical protein
MSMPGFSAQAVLDKVSGIYRGASGHDSAKARVEPARDFMSASCSEVSSDYNWHCTVRWGIANCRGSSTTYADGSYETEYSCT